MAEPVRWSSDDGPVHGWHYPPTNPDYVRSARPPAAAAGAVPRRPDRLRQRRRSCSPTSSGPAAASRCSTSTTAAAPASAARTGNACAGAGASSTSPDCIGGAQAMVEQGRADPARLVDPRRQRRRLHHAAGADQQHDLRRRGQPVRGRATWRRWPRDTHKFESRYLDGLVGPYPEARETYLDRSPLTHVDRLAAPLLLLQGDRRPGRAAEPGRADGGGRAGARACRWP